MHELRCHRRLILLPAAFWLAVQFVMASGFAVAAPSGADRAGAAIWICTPFGQRLMALDGGDADPPAVDAGAACYWCQAYGAAAAPAEPCVADDRAALPGAGPAVRFEPSDKVRGLRTAAFSSRAPPFASVA